MPTRRRQNTRRNQKQAVVRVIPRAGNKSAQLTRSIESARIKRKLVVSIGSVNCDADLESGEGIRMKKPYTLADLTPEDRKKIADWQAKAKSDKPKERPGFASLDAKLERVLALLTSGETPEQVQASIVAQATTAATAAPTAASTSALDRLELAIEEAVTEVRAKYEFLRAAGVKPTNVSHNQLLPMNPTNPMDQLQARVNRIRFQTVLQFQKGCQNVGIIKKSAGEK